MHDHAGVGRNRGVLQALILGIAALIVKVALSASEVITHPTNFAGIIITWIALCSFVGVGVALFVIGDSPVNGWGCIVVAWSLVPGDLNSERWSDSGWSGLGYVLEYGYLPASVALVLRYPHEKLSRGYRRFVLVLFFFSVGIPLLVVATKGRLDDNFYRSQDWPHVEGSAWWHDAIGVQVGRGVTAALLVVAAWLLLRRATQSKGLARQSILPLAAIGGVTSLAAALDQLAWLGIGLDMPSDVFAAGRNVFAAFIPVALLADLLRRRSAMADVSGAVLTAARSGNLESMQRALSGVLVDPTLLIGARQASGGWIGTDGCRWSQPHPTSIVREVMGDDGEPMLRFAFDGRAVQDPRVIEACVIALRIGLENTRLQTELLVQMAALQTSRARIAEAALKERRRVERDLHDGAQQSLLAAMTTLAKVDLVHAADAQSIARQARAQVNQALAELRDLARGIYPAVLVKGGLPLALAELCAKSDTGAALHVDPQLRVRRLEAGMESAMYFFVAEALVNVTKHAPAAHVEVSLQLDDTRVTVHVSDDGPGGGSVTSGRGLTGLQDRINALGGTMAIHSDPCVEHRDARGTTLYAVVPFKDGA